MLDLTKIIFGSIVIGGILRGDVPHDILLKSGIIGATATFITGLVLVTKETKQDKPVTHKRKRRRDE